MFICAVSWFTASMAEPNLKCDMFLNFVRLSLLTPDQTKDLCGDRGSFPKLIQNNEDIFFTRRLTPIESSYFESN